MQDLTVGRELWQPQSRMGSGPSGQVGSCTFVVQQQPQCAQASVSHLTNERRSGPGYFKEADRGGTCCPMCHVSGAALLKATIPVVEGLIVRHERKKKACVLPQRICSPEDVQDSSCRCTQGQMPIFQSPAAVPHEAPSNPDGHAGP